MCRLTHILLQTITCSVQMLVRVVMTVLLMIENIIRTLLQTIYNFISFMLQIFSLIPICMVFIITARLKCLFCCGDGCGGGYYPGHRGGMCDCIVSVATFVLIFFVLRATGVLDAIFAYFGYMNATDNIRDIWINNELDGKS